MEGMLPVCPSAPGKKNQHGENLKPACQHIQDQNNFGQGTETIEITSGTNGLNARANVVEAGQNSGQIGAGRKIVQRNKQIADNEDDQVGGKIGVGVGQHCFTDTFSVVADYFDLSRMQNLPDIAAQILKQQQDTGALYATASGACAGTYDHQHH